MRLSFSVVVLLLLTCKAAMAINLSPVCYKSNEVMLKIIGINHVQINENYDIDEDIKKNLADANIVFLENKELLPQNGIWSGNNIPKTNNDKTGVYKLHDVISQKDLQRMSRLLGNIPNDAWTDEFGLSSLPDQILAAKYTNAGGNLSFPGMYAVVHGKKTIESSFYSYALEKNIPTYSMEGVNDLFDNLRKDFDLLKNEIHVALDCSEDKICMDDFSAWFSFASNYDSSKPYDEIYSMFMKFPGQQRYTLPTRNEFQFKTVMSHIKPADNVLVIAGSSHVGGPIGLAKKFENSGFNKIECNVK